MAVNPYLSTGGLSVVKALMDGYLTVARGNFMSSPEYLKHNLY